MSQKIDAQAIKTAEILVSRLNVISYHHNQVSAQLNEIMKMVNPPRPATAKEAIEKAADNGESR